MPALLMDVDNNNLTERIIILSNHLTPEQQQQILNQIEQMVEDNNITLSYDRQ